MGLRHLKPCPSSTGRDRQRFVGTFSLIYISMFTWCFLSMPMKCYEMVRNGGQRTHAFIGD